MMIFNGEEVLPFFGEAVGCLFRDWTAFSGRQIHVLRDRLIASLHGPVAHLPFRPAKTIFGRK